jgi:transcriptional regulator with XRE-family HTH domain
MSVTVGQAIARERKKRRLSQKDLAQRVRKEDGSPISPQYLNDIERDRRNPPGQYLLDQFARQLDLPPEYLHLLAGQLPDDLVGGDYEPERARSAFVAFRRTLEGTE